MDVTELRARILEDHALLRGKAEVLEGLALRILRGDEDLGSALRLKGEEIQEHLVRHMGWEESALLPTLRRSGSDEVADQILSDHRAQRERISRTLVTLQGDEQQPVELARHMIDFVRWLERDMREEEANVLSQHFVPADASAEMPERALPTRRDDAT